MPYNNLNKLQEYINRPEVKIKRKKNYRRWYNNHKNNPDFKKARKEQAKLNREKYIAKYGIQSFRDRNNRTSKKYRDANPDFKKKNLDRLRKWRESLAIEVLTHYSNGTPKCACCGETEFLFLTIDHINNGGAEQRKEIYKQKKNYGRYGAGKRFYSWLKQHNYPEGYQVLCYNCNCGKQRNKGICCPHKGVIK